MWPTLSEFSLLTSSAYPLVLFEALSSLLTTNGNQWTDEGLAGKGPTCSPWITNLSMYSCNADQYHKYLLYLELFSCTNIFSLKYLRWDIIFSLKIYLSWNYHDKYHHKNIIKPEASSFNKNLCFFFIILIKK